MSKSAEERTKSLERKDLPLDMLVENSSNPNKMKAREFDLLCDNLQKTGLTDPILVKPIGGGKYRIVGGHHRARAAQFLGFTEVPCTIITDPHFDEDMENFQLVRMNVIHGRLDPEAFLHLYEQVAAKYSKEILQDAYGFADDAEFAKLIKQTGKNLPEDLQEKFKEAAKEIKTIDDLAMVLNRLFTEFGDTLPYGYMTFDFGGQDSIWVRCKKSTRKAFLTLGERCVKEQKTVDDIMEGILQLAASGMLDDELKVIFEHAATVHIPVDMEMPTLDNLAGVNV